VPEVFGIIKGQEEPDFTLFDVIFIDLGFGFIRISIIGCLWGCNSTTTVAHKSINPQQWLKYVITPRQPINRE
jgi:hypothetical protein